MNADVGLHHKQSELGLIPAEWTVKPISDCMRLINGRAFKPSEWASSGVPIIRIQNLNNPSAEFNYYPFDDIEDRNRIKPGDLVFAWSGTLGSSFGARSWSGPEGVLNQHIFKVIPDANVISPEYALIVFKRIEDDIAKKAHGFKTSFVHIKKADLDSTLLPLPCHHEQKAIALALNDIEVLISHLDQLIAKKRDIQQAAMQQLLTGQRRLPGFSGKWEMKRLGDLAEMGSGGTPLSSVTAYYDGDIPWVSISDMTKGGKVIESTERNLTALGFANSTAQIFPVGTVLYAMYASLGECSIAGKALCTSQAILGIRAKNNLHAEFLYYYLVFIKKNVKTLGQQGTQSNLNKGMVQDFLLSLPSLPEQTAIATILSDMDADLATLETRRDKALQLKLGMMQELLTGRIRLV